MKTYRDKRTGNLLKTDNPVVMEQYEKLPERYESMQKKQPPKGK